MTDTLLHWHQGKFIARVKYPDWFLEAIRLRKKDKLSWYNAMKAVGAEEQRFETCVDDDMDADVLVAIGPAGDRVVTMSADENTIEQVYIERIDDWLPLFTTHILPFIHAYATRAANAQLKRLANATISHARHGEGKHVCRIDGTSKIDDAADARELR